MADLLTMSEIESQFANEWVLIVDPKVGEDLEVEAGSVAFHSKDRDEVYREAIALRHGNVAILFTGEPAPGTAILI